MKKIVVIVSVALSSTCVVAESQRQCSAQPDRAPGLTWRYRVVDGERCWYRSETALPRSELSWKQKQEQEPAASAVAPCSVNSQAGADCLLSSRERTSRLGVRAAEG